MNDSDQLTFEYARGFLNGWLEGFVDDQIIPQLHHLSQDSKQFGCPSQQECVPLMRQYAEFLCLKGITQDWESKLVFPKTEEVLKVWLYHMKTYPMDYASLLSILQGTTVYHSEKDFLKNQDFSQLQQAPGNFLYRIFFCQNE